MGTIYKALLDLYHRLATCEYFKSNARPVINLAVEPFNVNRFAKVDESYVTEKEIGAALTSTLERDHNIQCAEMLRGST